MPRPTAVLGEMQLLAFLFSCCLLTPQIPSLLLLLVPTLTEEQEERAEFDHIHENVKHLDFIGLEAY